VAAQPGHAIAGGCAGKELFVTARIPELLSFTTLAPALTPAEAEQLAAGELRQLSGRPLYPASIAMAAEAVFALAPGEAAPQLVVISRTGGVAAGIPGERSSASVGGLDLIVTLAPSTAANLALARDHLPFLAPTPLGLQTSAGCGDRLGLATPGHIQAVRRAGLAPILAQQSVRENERTGRTPTEVVADAVRGVMLTGWRSSFGADADHLKTPEAIDPFVAAGYTFFTIDPGDHVAAQADSAAPAELEAMIQALPWEALESRPSDLRRTLAERPIELDGTRHSLTRAEVDRAAAKYGRVVAHTARMYRHLRKGMGARPFELEISVDETDSVTTLAEHIYIAAELKRLGVRWVSLAPRYVGEFEKGVDYIGDLKSFEASFARHAAVARTFGPYKLSLHSGSDKFRIYPIAARHTKGLVHLKTAGTSYLEALRAIAQADPALMRRIVALAVARYPVDRASYHVSAQIERLPDWQTMPDDELPALLDDFHAREILHVTYGSVLNHPDLRPDFFTTLRRSLDRYTELVAKHFDRHFAAMQG
jgi:hypothetical protein